MRLSLIHWEFPEMLDEKGGAVIRAQLKGHLEDFASLRPQWFNPPLTPCSCWVTSTLRLYWMTSFDDFYCRRN